MRTAAPLTTALAARAARRALAADALRLGGRGLAAGAGAGLVLVAAERIFGGLVAESAGGTLWPILLGGSAGAGLAAGLAVAMARRWREPRAALEIDERLGLKDRLSSALAFAGAGPDGFAVLAVRDAEATAPRVELKRALPVRPEWTWIAWPLLAGGAAAIGLLSPRVEWRRPGPTAAETVALAQQAAAEVGNAARQAREAVAQTLADRGVLDIATAEQLRQLESLEKELLSAGADPDQARVKAAQSLEALADQLQSQARADQAAHDALREALGAADAPADGPAEALGEALRGGDMAGAQEALRDLLNQMRRMDPAEREALARDLESLAERLAPSAPTTAEEAPATSGELAIDSDPPEGASPDPSPGAEPPPAEAESPSTKPPPEPGDGAGADEQPPPGGQPAPRDERNQAREGAREETEELRRNLRDAAREARETPGRERASDPSAERSRNPSSDQAQRDGAPRNRQDRQDGARREGTEKPNGDGDSQRDRRDSTESNREGQKPRPSPEPPGPGQKRDEHSGGEERGGGEPDQHPGGADEPADKPSDSPGEQQGDAAEPRDDTTPAGEGSVPGRSPPPDSRPTPPPPSGGDPGRSPDQGPGEGGEQDGSINDPNSPRRGVGEPRPGAERGEGEPAPGAASGMPDPSQQGGADEHGGAEQDDSGAGRGGGFSRLAEQLDRLAQREQSARQAPRLSRSLRQRAEQLLQQASDEEKQSLERWARALARERPERAQAPSGPWAGPTELVDARGEPTPAESSPGRNDRVIAEWFTNQGIDRSGAAARREFAEQFRAAGAGAEEAIEQQAVPRRHGELIRRIFRRYAERAETGEAPPAVDAPDASPTR